MLPIILRDSESLGETTAAKIPAIKNRSAEYAVSNELTERAVRSQSNKLKIQKMVKRT